MANDANVPECAPWQWGSSTCTTEFWAVLWGRYPACDISCISWRGPPKFSGAGRTLATLFHLHRDTCRHKNSVVALFRWQWCAQSQLALGSQTILAHQSVPSQTYLGSGQMKARFKATSHQDSHHNLSALMLCLSQQVQYDQGMWSIISNCVSEDMGPAKEQQRGDASPLLFPPQS